MSKYFKLFLVFVGIVVVSMLAAVVMIRVAFAEPIDNKRISSVVSECFRGYKKVETELSFMINADGKTFGVMLNPEIGATTTERAQILGCVDRSLKTISYDKELSGTTVYTKLQIICYDNQPLYENRKKKGKKK